jgi:hypothetical protein
VKIVILLLLVGCGVDIAPVVVAAGGPDAGVDAGCVPSGSYYVSPGDCEQPNWCNDGHQCPPHSGAFYCSNSGQCVGFAWQCEAYDAGAAIACH